jgi:hypothetical protein
MGEPRGGRERRKLKRVIKRIPIRFETGSLHGQGHIRNLSKQGMFIRSHLLPPAGEQVRILFVSPDGTKLELIATVRWTTAQLDSDDAQPGFGISIEDPGRDFLVFYQSILFC